jgi:hypothetical protein
MLASLIGDISDVYIGNLKSYDIVSVVACAGRDLEKARRKAELHGRGAPASNESSKRDPFWCPLTVGSAV